jgi:hypothetical protein
MYNCTTHSHTLKRHSSTWPQQSLAIRKSKHGETVPASMCMHIFSLLWTHKHHQCHILNVGWANVAKTLRVKKMCIGQMCEKRNVKKFTREFCALRTGLYTVSFLTATHKAYKYRRNQVLSTNSGRGSSIARPFLKFNK